MNHVFISYRHESEDHAREVRRLGELLREVDIPVELDQFFLIDHPGGPDEGWPKWCDDRAVKSACVLVIPSSGWFGAFNGTDQTPSGRGAAAEARLFRQFVYDEKGRNPRIRLAFVDSLPPDCVVPEELRAWHQFRPVDSDRELDQLIRWLADQLGLGEIESPTVRWPEPLADFQPDIADRHVAEWPAIRDMLSGKSRKRLLLLEAESGYGKSELLHQSVEYARQLEIPFCRIDFRALYSDIPEMIGRFALELDQHLPNFSREGGDNTNLLIKDLRALRRPVFLVLDTYEKASDVFQKWVCQNLLAEVERALAVTVIVAGQPRLPDVNDIRWRTVAQHLPLGPIREVALWQPWLERRYPDFDKHKADLSTLVLASGGVPKTFSDLCKTIAAQPLPPSP